MAFTLEKKYMNHFGVDLKSSDLNRRTEFAEDMMNAQYSSSGSIEKRPGYQGHAGNVGGYGQWTYLRVNPITGVDEKEVVTVDQHLYTLATTTLSVVYSGGDPSCEISIFLNSVTSTYYCQILEGVSIVLDFDLGVGFDETTPVTVDDLKTAINGLAGFAATVSGDATTPAAFLEITRSFDLAGGDLSVDAKYWIQVNETIDSPFQVYLSTRNDDDFENVSAIQLDNLMFFGNGVDPIYKYDGQTFYRAGIPDVASVGVAKSAGAITGTNYVHRIQYIQHDAAGNILEGNLFSTAQLSAAAEQFDLTIANIEDGSGFNTNCAIVAGAQAVVNTITVDDGSGGSHTMKVGDNAYFYDAVSASYVTRLITTVAATTITVAGAAVTVADNAVISNNLRIAIWRSKSSATTPFLSYFVDEIPNNSFVSTQAYTDNLTDAALGELLIPPVTDRSLPPKGKYVSQWNGSLMIGGNPEAKDVLYWSDVDGSEFFPNVSNQINIQTGTGDIIKGIAPNNEVFTVHGNNSFTVISGDILTGQIRVETKSRDIGCVSHSTLQEADGALVWLSPQGPRYSIGGQVPLPLGRSSEQDSSSRIDPAFSNEGVFFDEEKLKPQRAVGFTDILGQRYMLFVPAESTTSGEVHANGNSKVFVYDKTRDAWLIWNNTNFGGGICAIDDDVYFMERAFSSFEDDRRQIMYRRMNLKDAFDYADNIDPVSFSYSPQWESLGEPSILKMPIAIRIYSLELLDNNQFSLTCQQEINYQKGVTAAEFPVLSQGIGYGTGEYNGDPYGDPSIGKQDHPLSRDRTYSYRVIFNNAIVHENVAITGWEIEVSAPFSAEFKP